MLNSSLNVLLLALFALIFIGFVEGFNFKENSPCLNSVCTEISNCQSVLRNVRNSAPIHCGWSGKTPFVCCPESDSVLTSVLTSKSEVCATLASTNDQDTRPLRPLVPFSVIESVTVKPLIVNGRKSLQNSRPWMVALVDSGPGSVISRLFCGGSLISNRYILTAAHCFMGRSLNGQEIEVYLGSNDVNSAIRQDIDKIILHKGFKEPSWYNDIALIRLKNNMEFGPSIRPICLPPTSMHNNKFLATMTTVAGWGRLKFGGKLSEQLQEVNIPIVDNQKCNNTFMAIPGAQRRYPRGIIDSIMCGGSDEPKDACAGDSGGPMFIADRTTKHWTIIGVVSTGFQCAVPGIPAIYTRVNSFVDWILENAKD